MMRAQGDRAPQAPLARELRPGGRRRATSACCAPSIEVDVRLELKERADAEAIGVFAENLRHLLLARRSAASACWRIDPGFRTGCKVVVVDETGNLQDARRRLSAASRERKIDGRGGDAGARCARKHRIEAVAIGNGTAGRETEAFVRKLAAEGELRAGVADRRRSTRRARRSTRRPRSRARSSPTSTSPCAARSRSPAACRIRSPSW